MIICAVVNVDLAVLSFIAAHAQTLERKMPVNARTSMLANHRGTVVNAGVA